MRIGIIGAGPSGMMQMSAFAELANNGEKIPEIVCFERQGKIGGLWNYNWRTGVDADGEPVHNSMYRALWSNGPKEALEFPDYTFEQHFGEPTASYPPRVALRDYLEGYTKHHKMPQEWIRFNTSVKNVTYDSETKKFHVIAQSQDKNQYTEIFDRVIVATGHFSTPNMPDFKGMDSFSGVTIHAHDFRDGQAFKGQRVVIVGASYSSEDITSQLHKYGAKHVIITHRKKDPQGKWMKMGFDWPQAIEERPLFNNVEGNLMTFEDGTTAEVDVILMCTGYLHHFPFLGKELRLESENKLWVNALKNGVISSKNDQLYYLSMQNQFYTYNMFSAEAWYVRDLIMGRVDPNQPLRDSAGQTYVNEDFVKLQDNFTCDEDAFGMQGKFVECLMVATGYGCKQVDPAKFIAGINQTFTDWEHLKVKDIMGYRNYAHQSLVTGKMAPLPHASKHWINNKHDDSIEFYKNLHKE